MEQLALSMPPPLRIGQIVPIWGKVSAVGCRDGRRYYLFVHPKTAVVSLVEADLLPRIADSASAEQK